MTHREICDRLDELQRLKKTLTKAELVEEVAKVMSHMEPYHQGFCTAFLHVLDDFPMVQPYHAGTPAAAVYDQGVKDAIVTLKRMKEEQAGQN